VTPTLREATVNDKNTDSFARLRRRIYVKESEPLTRSKQVSPLLEIGTMGLKRRGLETGSTSTAPVPDPTNTLVSTISGKFPVENWIAKFDIDFSAYCCIVTSVFSRRR